MKTSDLCSAPSSPESNRELIVDDPMEGPPTEEVGIVCEYDFGWDKRGSGFTYDSKSGTLLLIDTLSLVLSVCLGVQVNGKPRVTTTKKIVQKVADFIQKSMEQ